MASYVEIGKKLKNGGLTPISRKQDFFQKSGCVTFVAIMRWKIGKIQRVVTEIFEDGWTDGQG